MTINNIFDGGDTYHTTESIPETPARIGRDLVEQHLDANSNNLAWVFYRNGPLGLGIFRVQDGVRKNSEGNLQIARTWSLLGKKIGQEQVITPPSRYLNRVSGLYLQLVGPEESQAGGIERTITGSKIGNYDLVKPLKLDALKY